MKPCVKLYEHQKKAVEFALKNKGNACLFLDCGLGKTLTALKIFEELKASSMLVVCPLSLISAAWIEDIEKFTDFTFCNLRKENKPAQIYLINYESYDKKKVPTDMIVLDESSKIKGYKSQITKTLIKDSKLYKHHLVMTGTPAPNTPLEYWPQITFVNKHILPESFYAFRNRFFHLKRGNQVAPYVHPTQLGQMFRQGFSYQMNPEREKQFLRDIQSVSFMAKKKDCLDLPEQTFQKRDVYLSASQAKVYKDMKRDMIAEIDGKFFTANQALTKLMRLRQVTSGFLMSPEGEATDLADNSKMKVLLDTLEEVGNKQVMIFCQFHKEIQVIRSKLNNSATLYGLTKDRNDSINGFKEGRYQYLIGHPRSMAHGLSFTNCDTMIFYSNDYSFEMREQAINRIHRATTTLKCTYIDLITKDTIDEDVLDVLNRKADAQELYERIRNTK